MINKYSLKIPYPKKFGIISFNTKKKVNFSFDNLSLFLFREENKIDTPEDFRNWKKEHSDFDLFVYAAYFAAKSYAVQNRKILKLQLNKFALGLAQANPDELTKLTEVWKRSQEYGIDSLGGKKKVTKN